MRTLILLLFPLALAGTDPGTVRFVAVNPAGACTDTYLTLNTSSGTVSQCVNGAWTIVTDGSGVPVVSQLPDTCTPADVPPLVLLNGPSPGLYGCTNQDTWTPVGPPVYRADAFRSLAEAVGKAGDNAEILLPDGYTGVLGSPLALAGSNITIRCESGARIAKAFDGDAITVTGTNVAIVNCRIDGQSDRYKGGLMVLNGARGILIRGSIFSAGAGIGLGIYGSKDVTVYDTIFSGNLGSPIFAQDGLDNIDIGSSTFDSSAASPPTGVDTIGVHTYAAGGTASRIRIHDNYIVHGGDNFAIEAGAFGANSVAPTNVSATGNTIVLVRDSNGAISYSTVNGGVIDSNHIDAGGHAILINGVELVTTTGVSVTGNSLSHISPSTAYTISINGGSGNTVRNNVFEGGIYVGTSRPDSPHADDNVIDGNTLTAAPAAPLPRGLIWFQCNTFQGSVNRNVVRNNTLNGNNSGVGVSLENDYWAEGASVDSNQMVTNQITGANTPVSIGPHVTNTTAH